MAFIKNFLIPLISWLFVSGILAWVGFLIYRAIKPKLPSRWHTKYKILRKPYPEEIIKYLSNQDDEQTIINDLIFTHNKSPEEVKEYIWIFREMEKLKGGIIKDGK